MSAVLLLLGWAVTIVAFWWTAWRLSRNWGSLGLGLARACLRSFAVSLALAPTGIVAGLVGFPCPASAAIIAIALGGWSAPENQTESRCRAGVVLQLLADCLSYRNVPFSLDL